MCVEKMCTALQCKSFSHFFPIKVPVYLVIKRSDTERVNEVVELTMLSSRTLDISKVMQFPIVKVT